MSPPEVTIILPTQGNRSTLAHALRSALAQDFGSYEIVIVDDSRPPSEWRRNSDLVELLASSRVRLVPFHQSRGCAVAKNAGLSVARGQWICYLDDDNEYRPNKVSAQHALATATGSPLVLCGLEMVAGGRHRLRQVGASLFSGDALVLGAAPDTNVLFHRRDAAVAWDETLRTSDDACFFHALVAHYGLTTVPNVPEPLVLYRVHGGPHENSGYDRVYRGQRRLLVRWLVNYSPRARRIALLRALVSFHKYGASGWPSLGRRSWQLLRTGGWTEWRFIANTIGVRLPLVRRWMIN